MFQTTNQQASKDFGPIIWVKTYYCHIWGNNHPLTICFRVPRVTHSHSHIETLPQHLSSFYPVHHSYSPVGGSSQFVSGLLTPLVSRVSPATT